MDEFANLLKYCDIFKTFQVLILRSYTQIFEFNITNHLNNLNIDNIIILTCQNFTVRSSYSNILNRKFELFCFYLIFWVKGNNTNMETSLKLFPFFVNYVNDLKTIYCADFTYHHQLQDARGTELFIL